MSKKNIDISNYEEWFIDHLDGNLTLEQDGQLRSFLLLHPELAEELEGMEALNLEASDIRFPDKGELLMPSDEELRLMSIAEEGPVTDIRSLNEIQISEIASWKKTLLKADTSIQYPDIRELLREEATPIIPLWAIRLAVAASIIGVISWVFFSSSENIYQPREGLVEMIGEDVDELLTADHSEFVNPESTEASEEQKTIPVPANAPLKAKQHKEAPSESIQYPPIEAPEEQIVEEKEQEPSSPIEETIDEPIPLLTEESPQEEEIPRSIEAESQESLALTSEKESESIKGQVKEYDSLLEFLKGTVKETVTASDLLAMEEISDEDEYVKTSLRIGRFEFSRGKRKK